MYLLFKIYLYLFVSRFDRKLGALDPIVGDFIKKIGRVFSFLWAIGIFLPLYLAILSIVCSDS